MFLKVAERDRIDLLNLRGTPAMFYYVILALTAAAFGSERLAFTQPCRLLLAGDPRK